MRNTALILVAMQNAFCSPEGSFWKRGYSILNIDSVLNTVRVLLSFAHKKGMLVIFTKLEYKSDYSDSGLLVKHLAPEIIKLGGYCENSRDSKLFDFQECNERGIVIVKKRYDPFFNTDLEDILKAHQITHLIVAGVLTNVCVESCVRSAFDRDFEVTVIRDATSTYSEELYRASLSTMERHFAKIVLFKELERSMDNRYKKRVATSSNTV